MSEETKTVETQEAETELAPEPKAPAKPRRTTKKAAAEKSPLVVSSFTAAGEPSGASSTPAFPWTKTRSFGTTRMFTLPEVSSW